MQEARLIELFEAAYHQHQKADRPLIIECDSRGQADYYRRSLYRVRANIIAEGRAEKVAPESKWNVTDFTLSVKKDEDVTLSILYNPKPLDEAIREAR